MGATSSSGLHDCKTIYRYLASSFCFFSYSIGTERNDLLSSQDNVGGGEENISTLLKGYLNNQVYAVWFCLGFYLKYD